MGSPPRSRVGGRGAAAAQDASSRAATIARDQAEPTTTTSGSTRSRRRPRRVERRRRPAARRGPAGCPGTARRRRPAPRAGRGSGPRPGSCRSGGAPRPCRKSETSPRRRAGTSTAGTPAARIITNVATAAAHGLTANVPTRVRNSPTKPDRPAARPRRTRRSQNRRVHGGQRRQAAHLGDRPVVGPLVDHADEEEQGAGDQAVVDHLQDRARQRLLLEHEDAERHEAHVAHRRVGDELLEVGLDHGHDRAVDDRDQAQDDDQRREVCAASGYSDRLNRMKP